MLRRSRDRRQPVDPFDLPLGDLAVDVATNSAPAGLPPSNGETRDRAFWRRTGLRQGDYLRRLGTALLPRVGKEGWGAAAAAGMGTWEVGWFASAAAGGERGLGRRCYRGMQP
jgi:hypothetical protein